MIEKHLKRIKKSETGNPADDEWAEVSKLSERIPEKDEYEKGTSLGEKLPQQIMEDVPERSIIIQRKKRDNIEKYEDDAPKLKDQFTNTAQYSKLVKNYISEKQSSFEKFKKQTEEFDKQISALKPERKHAFDLSKLNYKENNVEIIKNDLEILTNERELIKRNIIHFTNQIEKATSELNFKVEQIDDIQHELKRLEKKEILQNKIKTEEEALEIIKKEISYVGNVEQTKKVFGTINTIVDLLKSKNKSTQNELNDVKREFKILKENYEKLMSQIK